MGRGSRRDYQKSTAALRLTPIEALAQVYREENLQGVDPDLDDYFAGIAKEQVAETEWLNNLATAKSPADEVRKHWQQWDEMKTAAIELGYYERYGKTDEDYEIGQPVKFWHALKDPMIKATAQQIEADPTLVEIAVNSVLKRADSDISTGREALHDPTPEDFEDIVEPTAAHLHGQWLSDHAALLPSSARRNVSYHELPDAIQEEYQAIVRVVIATFFQPLGRR